MWSLYGALAKGSQDIHFDMGEMVAWSREAGIGTPKHPPFAAWLVRVWFSVFPLTDWSYYVFAMVLASFALWVAWRLSEPYLDGEKRVVGLVLLTFIPFFNFHALKYNANTVLIPLWALDHVVVPALVRDAQRDLWPRSPGSRPPRAMLGKYWSIFLLAGLGVAALADPRRAVYFRSARALVTIAVGALALAPHVAWIVANDFAPFTYAVAVHPATRESAIMSGIGFLARRRADISRRRIALAAPWRGRACAPSPTRCGRREPARRLVLIAFLAPLLLPALAAVAGAGRDRARSGRWAR